MNITEETIDSFLRGDLSGAELTAFNQAVAADPKLQQEVSIQQEIVDSVKQYRHQQLKKRLNSIDVKPVALPFYASTYMKLAASIGVVALLVGSFSLFNNTKQDTTTSNSDITSAVEFNTSVSENTSAIASTDKTNQDNIIASDSKNTLTEQTTKASGSIVESKKTVSTSTADKKSSSTPTFDEISEETIDSDNTVEGINDNFEMPAMNHGGNATISSPQIKVSIVKENNLGYRFFNNQLFLHGNFSNSTYELFELNNKPTKQLFLYFENNYYELIQGKTKITTLNPITDKSVLIQLTQLREH